MDFQILMEVLVLSLFSVLCAAILAQAHPFTVIPVGRHPAVLDLVRVPHDAPRVLHSKAPYHRRKCALPGKGGPLSWLPFAINTD
ncbi:hypothetical protein [Qipengyuania sp.]|uniref:hypothetical protein n=1 Tax=Qipengyuania sp. TaxID=2004515 RepID=UPI003C7ACE5F